MIGCPMMNEASSEARKATTRPTSSGSRQGRARSPLLRQQLADVHYHLCLRIASVQAAGRIPNCEASIGKVFGTELPQRIARTAVRAFGLYSNLRDEADPRAPMAVWAAREYVFTVPLTIAGGASEIQRNIIATRGLGLPRS